MFIAILSFFLGFLINEEVSLNRLCRSLDLDHEGWLLINCEKGFWVLVTACLLSFFKSWGWGAFLEYLNENNWMLPAGMYYLGNILAVRRVRGIFYTPRIALMGLFIAGNIQVFQGTLVIIVVSWMLLKNLETSMWLGQISLCLLLLLLDWTQGLFWIVLVFISDIISGRQSPFTGKIIKYFGKILGWRVTT